jgi:hypothetical protein
MTNTIYLLQLPYLDTRGAPMVVRIEKSDAEMLRGYKSHRQLDAGGDIFILTPIQTAVTHHCFQIGSDAY